MKFPTHDGSNPQVTAIILLKSLRFFTLNTLLFLAI